MKIRGRLGHVEVEIDLVALMRAVSLILDRAEVTLSSPFELLAICMDVVSAVFSREELYTVDDTAEIRYFLVRGLSHAAAEQLVRAVLKWIAYNDINMLRKLVQTLDQLMREDQDFRKLLDNIVRLR